MRDAVGTVYVVAVVGRALRRGEVDMRVADVLDVTGEFVAGDTVHVVTRGIDGGQGLIGTATVRLGAEALRRYRELRGEGDGAVVVEATGFTSAW